MPAEPTVTALLVDGAEVCARLSIGKSSLHRMIRSGKFPLKPVCLGRAVRYSTAELSAWVTAGCPAGDRWRALQQFRKSAG